MYLAIECIDNEQHVYSCNGITELISWLNKFDFVDGTLVIVTPNDYYYSKERLIERYKQGFTV